MTAIFYFASQTIRTVSYSYRQLEKSHTDNIQISVLYDADFSGSSCDETGRMVVPYGEARALLSGGEQDHDH